MGDFLIRRKIFFFSLFFLVHIILLSSKSIYCQEINLSENTYGVPGIIDMPIAGSFNDGEISFTSSNFGTEVRNSLAFQALPRVLGTFRYSGVGDKKEGWYYRSGHTTWDRSFDLRIDLKK